MGYESEKCINFADGSRTNCIADLTARLLTHGDGISTKEEESSPKIFLTE